MKAVVARSFLREFLEDHGAQASEPDPNRLFVEAGPELTESLGRDVISLAFNVRGLNEDPTSELATVGNPVFDRILELATDSGRIGVRYETSPDSGTRRRTSALTSAPDADAHLELSNDWSGFGKPFLTYVPLYCHVFRVETSIDDAADVLEVVCIDGAQRTSLPQTPDLVDRWMGLESEPETGRTVPKPLPVPEIILERAIEAMGKRLRKRTSRIRRTAEARLAKETESIGEYYQGLVAETRSASRRWVGGSAAREEKIRILQLDWKRRMEEARTFWMPKIDVSLVSVGVMQRPRTAYPLQPAGKPTPGKTCVFYDPATDEFSVPAGAQGVTERPKEG